MKKSKNAPKSILIVEDDKTSVILLEKLLKNYGYSVADIVETGEDALVKAGTIEPDLILMDITLKGKLDGIEAAAEISNKYHIPIVFMTANTDDSTIERAKVTMPYGYILKPYDKNMLYATIEMALYKFNTEGMLIESEKRNRDILSSIPDVMFTLDEEGNFLHEVEADIAQRIWPKKVSEVALPQIKKAIDSGNETTFEYTLKKSDSKCYFEARILVSADNRVLVIVRDITGRKHAELELQDYKQKLEELVEKRTFELNTANKSLESESTLRMKMGENLKIFSHAIEQSPNMVVFLDKHGTIEYVNRKFSEISGYSPDEVVETVVSKQGNKVIPEPEIWNSIISVKKWDGEIYNVNKKGDLYYLRAYVTFIKGEDSRISHYILVAEDITRIKKEKMAIENVKESIDKSRSEKLDLELDWREWKEKMLSRNVSRTDKSLFRNINNSFTQGAGFGTLISLLEMLRTDSEVTGDKYIVDRKIFELILENVTISQNAFKTFSNIDWIISNDFDLKKVAVSECYDLIKAVVNDASALSTIHDQKIIFGEIPTGHKNVFVTISREFLYKALYEVVVNALKFSKYNASVLILISIVNRYMIISIINEPEKSDDGIVGIPTEYEKVVFEPFYRLTKNVYEQYKTLDFGLGLTLVEKIISKHGGEVIIENIKDHSNLRHEPQVKVNLSISLPINMKT